MFCHNSHVDFGCLQIHNNPICRMLEKPFCLPILPSRSIRLSLSLYLVSLLSPVAREKTKKFDEKTYFVDRPIDAQYNKKKYESHKQHPPLVRSLSLPVLTPFTGS